MGSIASALYALARLFARSSASIRGACVFGDRSETASACAPSATCAAEVNVKTVSALRTCLLLFGALVVLIISLIGKFSLDYW